MKTTKITHKSKTPEEFFTRIREHAKCLDEDKESPAPKRLGILEDPNFKIPDSFWDPLPEEELRLWEGEGEDDLLTRTTQPPHP
jgi:hypothetical protein